MKITIAALGSRGDVHPLIALGTGLKRAGCGVRLAAHTLFQKEAAAQGLEFFPVNALFRQVLGRHPKTQRLASDLDPLKFMAMDKNQLAPVMDPALAGIHRACTGADLILYTPLALPAHAFADEMNIPAWPVCLQPLVRTRAFPTPLVSARFRVPGLLNRFSHMVAEKCLVRFFRKNSGLNGRLGVRDYFREVCQAGTPVINGFSPSLVPKPPDWGENLHITGFWFPGLPQSWQPHPGLEAFLANGPPPVCVGFGSMEDPDTPWIIQCCVDTLRRMGRRAVVLSGWGGTMANFDNDPGVFATQEIPHAWLFPRVAAAIHHGGAGTTAAAVRAGVPAVIIPFFFDQRFWADRLHSLGAAPPPLPKQSVTEQALASRLETIPFIKEQIRHLSKRMNQEDGIGTAVNLILEKFATQNLKEA